MVVHALQPCRPRSANWSWPSFETAATPRYVGSLDTDALLAFGANTGYGTFVHVNLPPRKPYTERVAAGIDPFCHVGRVAFGAPKVRCTGLPPTSKSKLSTTSGWGAT